MVLMILIEVCDDTLVKCIQEGFVMAENVYSSIIEHFSELPDPRILLKTQHRLVEIVTIALCTALAGADDWAEIALPRPEPGRAGSRAF